MSKQKPDKKIAGLEPHFKDVLVCQNPEMSPFIEVFVEDPENVALDHLGIIAGVFEITDESEDSSYIVNYLISVIKKEFYAKPRRGTIESFEAALHKANLALSKMASRGVVNWIGTLSAVCIVIERSSLHLAAAGKAFAFLARKSSFMDIAEAPEEPPEPNPIRTFQDVLSGRLEKDDKLILGTDRVFQIFSAQELKRSAQKFTKDNFIQFLRTALGNELDRTAVLVVDIEEREKTVPVEMPAKSPDNVFSQKAFSEIRTAENQSELEAKRRSEKEQLVSELKIEYEKVKDAFYDKKTGHIYIKEDQFESSGQNNSSDIVEKLKSSITLPVSKSLGKTRGLFKGLSKNRGNIAETAREKTEESDTALEERLRRIHPPSFASRAATALKSAWQAAKVSSFFVWQKILVPSSITLKRFMLWLQQNLNDTLRQFLITRKNKIKEASLANREMPTPEKNQAVISA